MTETDDLLKKGASSNGGHAAARIAPGMTETDDLLKKGASSNGGHAAARIASAMTETDQLLAELESLLARQLDFARQGQLDSLPPLAEQADELVRRICLASGERMGGQAGERTLRQSSGQVGKRMGGPDAARDRVRELYRRLGLALASHKSLLSDRIRRLGGGRKAARAYGRTT